MLRDLKLFRRNAGKKPEIEEIENVPVKPSDVPASLLGSYANRGPLSTIQDPAQCPKPVKETKIERTPTKVQGKGVSSGLRTPEKHAGVVSRNKFGWAQKNEAETRNEGKSEANHLPRGPNMTPRSVRTRNTGSQSECSSTQSTPTKSVSKPPIPGFASLNTSRPNVNGGARVANFSALAKGVPVSCASPLVLNNDTIDVPHFDLKEDPSFWMDHNVQVLIRVRPPNSMERSSHGHTRCLKQESAQTITWIGQPESRFTFDHVACETVNQEMLFRVAGLPMVENCLSGYNSCMFAYGQTGSGKTYTMLGEIDDLEVKPSLDRGMTPRIFEFLFARIRAEEEIRRDENLKYYCKCSFLEIYNEQIADLLDPSCTNLLLREDIKKGVYVENLTEYEVQSVNDIIKLLTEGAANRKVGATNMNRESSRSHSVFTCVIESRWEKDSTTNLRFARLNLVDLAGSERQKTSGAEGERLKEAANINKSLSTLGHVIMLLVDVAQGKLRHIPYRDSRLTFLLQESLGGNSKTMIIANVSPSICCSAETLSTLKFAQRAKLIQNNAVINEDASGDVNVLQHQIQLLKEELSVLKRRNVSRTLSFPSTSLGDTDMEGHEETSKETSEMSLDSVDDTSRRSISSGVVKVSPKQLKSLEATLAGAIRREQMAESSMKQLEAEIEQLNRLVNQREEDTRSTKMMLRFREDKIQRMESLLDSSMPLDSYLMEENTALYEEIQLLRAKIDKHPEVTRFALENIRLLDKLRRFQDFYEEGEKEVLLDEVSELRTQLLQCLDGNNEQYNHLNANLPYELRKTTEELEVCRNSLNSCLEVNARLTREIDDLHIQLNILKSSHHGKDAEAKDMRESRMDVQAFETLLHEAIHKEKTHWEQEILMEHAEEIMSFQLELDILKIILQEERLSREKVEGRALTLSTEIETAKARCLEMSMRCEDMEVKLKESRAVTEALESQQILLINDLEGLRDDSTRYLELLNKQEQEASSLREQICAQELRDLSAVELSESRDSSLQVKLKRMEYSLEKAKRLNTWYQSDQAFKTSHEQEMDDVRKQVEVETAEVIISLQEELTTLQQQVKDSNGREIETRENMLLVDIELKDLKDRLYLMTQDNKRLNDLVQDYDGRETESKESMLLLHTELKNLNERLCLMTQENKKLNDLVQDYDRRETESKESMLLLHTELKDLKERLCLMAHDNTKLNDIVQDYDGRERERNESMLLLNTELKDLNERLCLMTQDNKRLNDLVQDYDGRETESTESMLLLHNELKDLNERLCLMTQDNKSLNDQVQDYDGRETESKESMLLLQNEMKDLNERLCLMAHDNTRLNGIVQDYDGREIERKETIVILETELQESKERLCLMTRDNMKLHDLVQEKDNEIKTMTEEWEILAGDIEEAIADGHGALTDASYQMDLITICFPPRNYVNEQVGKILSSISEKDLKIEELQRSLVEAQNLKNDVEWKLTSLRGAALAITEAQQEENSEKEREIQALRRELEVSEECCVMLKQKLSEEEAHVQLMEGKLEDIEKDILLKTRERLNEFKLGVSTLNSCMNEYVEQIQPSGKIDLECVNGDAKGQNVTVTSPDNSMEFQAIGHSANDSTKKDVESLPCEVKYQSKGRTSEDANARDLTIHLLRNEIESALESLKGVQAQMAKLFEEKEEISNSEKQSKKSMECLTSHLLALEAVICSSERQIRTNITELEDKLLKLEKSTEEVIVACVHKEKVFDLELHDAKVVARAKTAEAASLLAKFEEAQETMKEADMMVNALVIANDSSKLEIERLKEMAVKLTSERDSLSNQVESLQLSNNQKDQLNATLEKQLFSDFSDTRSLILTLEDIILDVQTAAKEQFESILDDFQFFKFQILNSTKLTWSWLEDVWSEMVAKDCAMSVLHLCHMGVMLEAVNGLNVENGLLHHGMCESDSVIMTLKERNSKVTKELEMFGVLKGKLLVDIKNSFDRISRNEDEARMLSSKLCSFGKKISDLHAQEELMLARSNFMGYELSRLIDELDMQTKNDLASLSEQINFLRVKEELAASQVDLLTADLTAKDFESLVLASELQQIGLQKDILEHEQEALIAFFEDMKEKLIIHNFETDLVKHVLMDAEAEVSHLEEVVEESNAEKVDLSQKLKEFRARFLEVVQEKKALEQDVEALEQVARLNDHLKSELAELMETKEKLTAKVQLLETESAGHIKDGIIKEIALRASIHELEKEMDHKDANLDKLCSVEMENESLRNEVRKLKSDCDRVFHDLKGKKSESEISRSHMLALEPENLTLQEKISLLGDCITILQSDCEMKNRELKELLHCQSVMEEELSAKREDLEVQINIASSLKEENDYFRSTLLTAEKNVLALRSLVRSNVMCSMDTIQAVNYTENQVFHVLDGKNITLLENVLHDGCENKEMASKLIMECEYLESCIEELTSENISFQSELLRKDNVLKGLLFDLSLLQESASNAKDQKDEVEVMVAAIESLEDELALRSAKLAEAIVHNQIVEALLLEKLKTISDIELNLCEKCDSLKLLTDENILLKTQLEDVSLVKRYLEEELEGKKNNLERLEEENYQMDNVLGHMNTLLEGLKNDLNKVTAERDHLKSDMDVWKEKLEQSQALAEEKEALAVEACEIAESRKTYAEDKEEEVKLLERSVEELESTINALENKADILKGEAERQRLLREELETEFQVIKNQMITVSTPSLQVGTKNNLSGDCELQRNLEEKDRSLQETWEQIRALEKNIEEKDAEISQCRAHISELNLHAEAQAHEYKQKFKALEAMAEQVKPDPVPCHMTNSSTKLDKNASKSRGSGSPFKCMGLGLSQQINSEKDEELAAQRLRIEELEALAASRQKEIFMLNARLAAAESMTHDVIRDLLGVKLDMNHYASMLDHQQVRRIAETAHTQSEESLGKEQEVVIKLKQQLKEFIEERQGWIDDINQKHADLLSAQISIEKLRQIEQSLSTENELLKKDITSHKKKVMELEDEVKKLSGQQNLQQRIHHHAKIKEENNLLKTQIEDLSIQMQHKDKIISRIKEIYAARGRMPSIDLDEEQRLKNKLKEAEDEKMQLGQELLWLCTSIIEAAGLARPEPGVSLVNAEEALKRLKDRFVSMERELQDLKIKNKIFSERVRLSELKQQTSPFSSRTNDCTTPERVIQTPFFTALDTQETKEGRSHVQF